MNTSTVSGWVFNKDDGANALNVVITVDGNATTVTADQYRPDLVKSLGSPNHGFVFSMPALATGAHTVIVDLQDPYTNYYKRLKAAVVKIAPPVGSVDVLNKSIISGWAYSAANGGGAVQVVVTLDGQSTTLTADQWRGNLTKKLGSPLHAFNFTVPPLSTGKHWVSVDVIDPSTSAVTRIRNGTIMIAAPRGSVDILNASRISGWAYSDANNSAANDVILTINGNQYLVKADAWRGNLTKTLGSPMHAFNFSMPTLKLGVNSFAVDVVDTSTGLKKRIKSGTIKAGGPVGAVNVFNTWTISGWGFSPVEGAAPLNAVITINGQATTVVADDVRQDVAKKYGSAAHGFTFAVPTLPPGTSAVTVDLVDPYNGQKVRLKSGKLVNRPPAGTVDLFSATRIAGWAADPDTTDPLQVQIKVNGVALGSPVTANLWHKGKGGTGFDVSGDFAGKVVEVFALDAPSGQAYRIWTNNAPPKGVLNVATASNVRGWAVDPNDPSTPVTVRVDIDGVTLTTTTANLSRPDAFKAAHAVNVGFSVDIPGLTPGAHTIAVYALDGQSTDTAPVLLGRKTVTNAAPLGSVDVANSSVVSGWALDPDLGAAAATVNVYIDDAFFATVSADQTRNDLTRIYGSPNHGFSVDLSALSTASHAITVTAVDNRVSNQPEVVIYDSFINNQAPVGEIEQFTSHVITGWAYDPDATTDAIPVDVYLDGVYSTTVTANLANDNAPLPGHGFSVDIPMMNFGTHTIDVYASESQGNVSILFGSRTISNLRPIGMIESTTSTNITGWAADPDRLGESVQIRVFVNGTLAVSGNANMSRPDLLGLAPLNSLPSYAYYGFSVTLPSLSAGLNQIDVYAVDLNNNQLTAIGSTSISI